MRGGGKEETKNNSKVSLDSSGKMVLPEIERAKWVIYYRRKTMSCFGTSSKEFIWATTCRHLKIQLWTIIWLSKRARIRSLGFRSPANTASQAGKNESREGTKWDRRLQEGTVSVVQSQLVQERAESWEPNKWTDKKIHVIHVGDDLSPDRSTKSGKIKQDEASKNSLGSPTGFTFLICERSIINVPASIYCGDNKGKCM